MCHAIIDEKLPIKWVCLTRIDLMDYERLEVMKNAGCKRLYIGIESGSNKNLEYYKKGYKREDIIPAIDRARDLCLEVVGYFLIGSLKETEEDFQETLEIAKKCKLDLIIWRSISNFHCPVHGFKIIQPPPGALQLTQPAPTVSSR